MRFILDTNVIIPLEDSSKLLESPLASFVKSAHSAGHVLLYNEATIADIERDKDRTRKDISLSRLRKYHKLDGYSPNPEEITDLFGPTTNPNDCCDNKILHSLYANWADFLISEDIEIHKKARKIGISDRVLYIQQAVDRFVVKISDFDISYPGIRETYLSSIALRDVFFESLIASYIEFPEWYTKCQREGRKAWIINDGTKIAAALIYKYENDEIVTRDHKGLPGSILKICTFKVAELCQGRKFGELLLKKAFSHAFEKGCAWVYLTVRNNTQPHLIDLLESFGFHHYGESLQKNGEIDIVLVKEMLPRDNPTLSSLEFTRKYYPWFRFGHDCSAFITPIRPEFHRQLFPEYQSQVEMFENESVAGNAIKQAYLSYAKTTRIHPGDILFFYRSVDYKSLTSFGIVENSEMTSDYARILQLTKKRTVYSNDDIQRFCRKPVRVILFQVLGHFDQLVKMDNLSKLDILGSIQSTRMITKSQATKILKENCVKNCFFAD